MENAIGSSMRNRKENAMENEYKVYVDVKALFTKAGKLLPFSVRWTDGTEFEIQRITEIRRAASLKAGGVAIRYTCIIYGWESHLYYDEHNRWYVERK